MNHSTYMWEGTVDYEPPEPDEVPVWLRNWAGPTGKQIPIVLVQRGMGLDKVWVMRFYQAVGNIPNDAEMPLGLVSELSREDAMRVAFTAVRLHGG